MAHINTGLALSTYYHLFITNDPPSDADEKGIRSLLVEAEAQCALLESGLDQDDPNIVVRCDQLRIYTTALRSAISPLRCVPSEILIEIFLVKGRWDSPYYDILDEHTGPWLIAKVCRRWRDIALSCP